MTYTVEKKTAILVITVGRSGSSCLSGILQILGVPFGENVLEADVHNPKGFFENKANSLLNGLIVSETSRFYSTPQFISWESNPKRAWYVRIIKKNIKKEFENSTLFGLKNIFLSYLLPLYKEALHELGYNCKVIVALRDPKKVYKSFEAWNGLNCTPDLLYKRLAVQFSMMLKYVFDMDTIAIDYDDLLSNPKVVVNKITAFIPGLRGYHEAKEEIDLFLEPSLNHH